MHTYTHIHNPRIGLLHIHSLNPLNSLFLLSLKSPKAVGTKDIEYLTVPDLGNVILALRLMSLLSVSGLSGGLLCCKISISLFVVRLRSSVLMESCIFSITPHAFMINLSILLLSCIDTFPPTTVQTTLRWKHLRSKRYRTSGGAAN